MNAFFYMKKYLSKKYLMSTTKEQHPSSKIQDEQPEEKDDNRLYVPIFLKTTLPKDGWIQGCIICNANTSNVSYYIDYERDDVGYQIYCCRNCCASAERNEDINKEYSDIIYEYIEIYKDVVYEKVDIVNRLNKSTDPDPDTL